MNDIKGCRCCSYILGKLYKPCKVCWQEYCYDNDINQFEIDPDELTFLDALEGVEIDEEV